MDTAGGNVDWSKPYENQYGDALGLKTDSPCDLGSHVLVCTQRALSQHITEAHTSIPPYGAIHNNQVVLQTRNPSAGAQIRKMRYVNTMDFDSA